MLSERERERAREREMLRERKMLTLLRERGVELDQIDDFKP